jgi:hypothetical protein
MRVFLLLIIGQLASVGCSRADGTAPSADKESTPQVSKVANDYKHLLTMTDGPVPVNPELAMLCTGVTQQALEHATVRTGPHTNTTVRVYMNAPASKAFREGPTPYPVGSVIVKQKEGLDYYMPDRSEARTHDGVGGMIKRAPGFDAAHGDWEYFYFEDPSKIESGKIDTCVKCHEGAAAKDHVFGDWAHEER